MPEVQVFLIYLCQKRKKAVLVTASGANPSLAVTQDKLLFILFRFGNNFLPALLKSFQELLQFGKLFQRKLQSFHTIHYFSNKFAAKDF